MNIENFGFVFSEGIKLLGLVFLGLVAAKAISALRSRGPGDSPAPPMVWVRGTLYSLTLGLVIFGARGLGVEFSAGIHDLAGQDDFSHLKLADAYLNARHAVELRPGNLSYWNVMSAAEFLLHQYHTVLNDEPTLRALSGGKPDELTTLRFAYCHYFLGQYDAVFPLTEQMIQENHSFAAPYVLEGTTYMAQKQFARAQRRFLDVLQFDPVQEAAVEGLAHTHYLMGDSEGTLEVLNDTQKFAFTQDARQRIDSLKAFYAQ